MARSELLDMDHGQQGWDTVHNDNMAKIGSAPFPVVEYATVGALPAANANDRCLASVTADGSLWISDGASWRHVGFKVKDADGLGSCQVIRKAFAAGAGGAPDDVTIYNANAPFLFRVVDVKVLISTNVGGATVTLRDAAAGAGNALSDALDAATTGTKRDAALTATGTVAEGGSLILRRSDSGVAGEIVVLIERE